MAAATPVVEFFKDDDGKDRWRLKARNGEIVCQSEGYASQQMAMKGWASVARDAGKALWKVRND